MLDMQFNLRTGKVNQATKGLNRLDQRVSTILDLHKDDVAWNFKDIRRVDSLEQTLYPHCWQEESFEVV